MQRDSGSLGMDYIQILACNCIEYFDRMGRDVWLSIFQYISIIELSGLCMVCRLWRSYISNGFELFRKYSITELSTVESISMLKHPLYRGNVKHIVITRPLSERELDLLKATVGDRTQDIVIDIKLLNVVQLTYKSVPFIDKRVPYTLTTLLKMFKSNVTKIKIPMILYSDLRRLINASVENNITQNTAISIDIRSADNLAYYLTEIFDSFPKMTKLDISHTETSNLMAADWTVLKELYCLKLDFLSRNTILMVELSILKTITKLVLLGLSNVNKIEIKQYCPMDVLESLTKLKILKVDVLVLYADNRDERFFSFIHRLDLFECGLSERYSKISMLVLSRITKLPTKMIINLIPPFGSKVDNARETTSVYIDLYKNSFPSTRVYEISNRRICIESKKG